MRCDDGVLRPKKNENENENENNNTKALFKTRASFGTRVINNFGSNHQIISISLPKLKQTLTQKNMPFTKWCHNRKQANTTILNNVNIYKHVVIIITCV